MTFQGLLPKGHRFSGSEKHSFQILNKNSRIYNDIRDIRGGQAVAGVHHGDYGALGKGGGGIQFLYLTICQYLVVPPVPPLLTLQSLRMNQPCLLTIRRISAGSISGCRNNHDANL